MQFAVQHVRAPNPGPMTLTGTNSYVVRFMVPGRSEQVLFIDPGCEDPQHLRALRQHLGANSQALGVLVTHFHADHQGGAASLASSIGAPIYAGQTPSGALRVAGALPVAELQDVFAAHGLPAQLHEVRGHTDDSVMLHLSSSSGEALISGDVVLGEGPGIIDMSGGGDLRQLLSTVRWALELPLTQLFPGHGPVLEGAHAVRRRLETLLAHRLERLEQVRTILERLQAEGAAPLEGAATPVATPLSEQITRELYPALEGRLLWAAGQNVVAALHYLQA